MPTDVPIACSLEAPALSDRRERFRALAANHLVRSARAGAGATLEFRDPDGSVEAVVRELARAEKACCPFFDLTVARDGDVVRLEIAAPAEGQAFVDALLAATGTVT
jgi:hypothetical protein